MARGQFSTTARPGAVAPEPHIGVTEDQERLARLLGNLDGFKAENISGAEASELTPGAQTVSHEID